MQHLLSINNLNKEILLNIINKAKLNLDENLKIKKNNILQNKIIANLFFEPSTRTHVSFQIAAYNLGAKVINLDLASSSITKGENILDTVNNLIAMGVDAFIIRHPENNMPDFIAKNIGDKACIINAGDGTNQHPTQALLDMMTINHYKKNFEDLNITIVGNIEHSRVANSDIAALHMLGVKNINLVSIQAKNDNLQNLKSSIHNADVIIALRIQKERMKQAEVPNFDDYFKNYGLTLENIKLAKPDVIIMHPGPMNRNVEISDELADSEKSVILQQVTMGVAIRMAVLELLLLE